VEPLTLTSLPLFPLGTVLYPGGLLPLRIFEVRYLDMVRKCHKHGAPFGVIALNRGSEVQRPAGDAGLDHRFLGAAAGPDGDPLHRTAALHGPAQ
jgi:hypothetical protein